MPNGIGSSDRLDVTNECLLECVLLGLGNVISIGSGYTERVQENACRSHFGSSREDRRRPLTPDREGELA